MATAVAVLVVAVLLAGIFGVPVRSMQAPQGYDQSREHWNTKNSTRFEGSDVSTVAARLGQAVYPATDATNTPDSIILYTPSDWQGGLVASSLLRPLNALLLPTTATEELARLHPKGSSVLGGAQLLLMNGAQAPSASFTSRALTSDQVPQLLSQAHAVPQHVLIVDPRDPATALLAAPWAAYSNDLIVFDAAQAPAGLPRYALGSAHADGATAIGGSDPAATAVAFAQFSNPQDPTFGWDMNASTFTGYRAYTLARPDDPAMALMSANLARRGKPGPLLWSGKEEIPQAIKDYLWSQRPAFWLTPSDGPFHHFWVLGDTSVISFPAQAQADYAVEIGPYKLKGTGMSGMDMLAAAWIALGLASALWIAFHQAKFLRHQNWVMRLAWPLLALTIGPFGIPFYYLAYHRPVLLHGKRVVWDRPLWLQALVATASSVGFGGVLMVATGFVMTMLGLPLLPNHTPLFWLGSPMIVSMIASYVVAVLVSWLLFQTPMLAMFRGRDYMQALPGALPVVMASMASVSLAMFPAMWLLMTWELPMMPTEKSILWFGVMFFTVFLGFLVSIPFNYVFIRGQRKAGLM